MEDNATQRRREEKQAAPPNFCETRRLHQFQARTQDMFFRCFPSSRATHGGSHRLFTLLARELCCSSEANQGHQWPTTGTYCHRVDQTRPPASCSNPRRSSLAGRVGTARFVCCSRQVVCAPPGQVRRGHSNIKRLPGQKAVMNSITAEVALRLEVHDIGITLEHLPSVLNVECDSLSHLSQGAHVSSRLTAISRSLHQSTLAFFLLDMAEERRHNRTGCCSPTQDIGQGGFRQAEEQLLPTWVLLGGHPSSKEREADRRVPPTTKSEDSSTVPQNNRPGRSFELCSVAFGTSSRSCDLIFAAHGKSEDSFTAPRNASPSTLRTGPAAKGTLGSARGSSSRRPADSVRRTSGRNDGTECSRFFALLVGNVVRCPTSRGSARPHLCSTPVTVINVAASASFKASRYKSSPVYVSKAKKMHIRDGRKATSWVFWTFQWPHLAGSTLSLWVSRYSWERLTSRSQPPATSRWTAGRCVCVSSQFPPRKTAERWDVLALSAAAAALTGKLRAPVLTLLLWRSSSFFVLISATLCRTVCRSSSSARWTRLRSAAHQHGQGPRWDDALERRSMPSRRALTWRHWSPTACNSGGRSGKIMVGEPFWENRHQVAWVLQDLQRQMNKRCTKGFARTHLGRSRQDSESVCTS